MGYAHTYLMLTSACVCALATLNLFGKKIIHMALNVFIPKKNRTLSLRSGSTLVLNINSSIKHQLNCLHILSKKCKNNPTLLKTKI